MSKKFKEGALTEDEKKIAKRLLNDDWRGQDILALINTGREFSTNSGRITGVKKDGAQTECTDDELAHYFRVQSSLDLRTGLNPYRHERIVRARDAMILAVQLFNSSIFKFKSEVFSVLSNISWTYLCHERLCSLGVDILDENGKSLPLSAMQIIPELDLPAPIQANLSDIKSLRDKVEHHTLGQSDILWRGLFQANCLNFEHIMCKWFGNQTSLSGELSFSLQFIKPDIAQIAELSKYDIPPEMLSFNSDMKAQHSDKIKSSTEYEFTVIYTMAAASKDKSHIQFFSPDSAEGKEISNVLIKYKPSDEFYPFKPKKVVSEVRKRSNSDFKMHHHTNSWKHHKIRPANGKPDVKKTNAKYCVYHKAHRDYTYSQAWVDLLVSEQTK